MRYFPLIITLIAAQGCAVSKPEDLAVSGRLHDSPGKFVYLSLATKGKRPVCFPSVEISPKDGTFTVIDRDGKAYEPITSANREIDILNGVDVADGLTIVQPGHAKNLTISLNNFNIGESLDYSVIVRLTSFDCERFWG